MPDLCSMLRPSTYDDTACVNAAIEINVLDYIVTMCNVNGAYPGTYEPHTDGWTYRPRQRIDWAVSGLWSVAIISWEYANDWTVGYLDLFTIAYKSTSVVREGDAN